MADYDSAPVIIGPRQHVVELQVVEESIRSISTDAIIIFNMYCSTGVQSCLGTWRWCAERESKPEGQERIVQERVVGGRFGGCEYENGGLGWFMR